MSKRAAETEAETEDNQVQTFMSNYEREEQAKKLRMEEPSTDMLGKTVVIVDGRERVATPLLVAFVIDEAMPLRLRQSMRVAKKHSFCVVTCSKFDWTAENRSVLSDDGANTADGLVQEARSYEDQEQDDKDCEDLNEYLTKQLTTETASPIVSKPDFVIYLQ